MALFDDLILWAILIGLASGGGWLLGIAGDIRAGRVLREVAALRDVLFQ